MLKKGKNKGSYERIGIGNEGKIRNPVLQFQRVKHPEELDLDFPPEITDKCSAEEEENKEEENKVSLQTRTRKGTIISSFYNLSNTILGSGMLGLPYAYSKAGWLLGTFFLLLAASIASFSLHLLSVCALTQSMPSSFHKVGESVLPSSSIIVDIAVAIKCFGVATSYLIVIGDLMPEVFNGESVPLIWKDRRLWITLLFIVVAGLSFLRNLDSLKFTSFLSLLFVVFLTILIGIYSLDINSLDPCESHDSSESCHGDISVITFDSSTLRVFPIFIFSFSCHQNIFGIVNELTDLSITRMNQVIIRSVCFGCSIYLIVANCGYFTYGSELQSNVLLNYPMNHLTRIARVFVSLLVAFSYPLQLHPGRLCLLSIISHFSHNSTIAASSQHNHSIIITISFLVLSYLLATFVSDLGVVLSLVGATGSTMVSFILPGFIYFFMFRRSSSSNLQSQLKLYGSLLLGCAGLILTPLCVTLILISNS